MSDLLGIGGLGAIADLAKSIINKVFPDKSDQEKAVLAQAMAEAQQEFALTQAQITANIAAAKSQDRFASRARPACIWVGAVSMAYVGLVDPFLKFVAQVWFHYQGAFPAIDTTVTFQVLFALLGVSGMRSFDKVRKS